MQNIHTTKMVPSICKGEKPEYEGFVILRAPSYFERTSFTDVAQIAAELSVDDMKTIQAGGEDSEKLLRLFAAKKQVKIMQNIVSSLKDFVVELSITRVSDGHQFSLDEMIFDSDMVPALQEMATQIIGKFRVGELTPPS